MYHYLCEGDVIYLCITDDVSAGFLFCVCVSSYRVILVVRCSVQSVVAISVWFMLVAFFSLCVCRSLRGQRHFFFSRTSRQSKLCFFPLSVACGLLGINLWSLTSQPLKCAFSAHACYVARQYNVVKAD